MELGEEIKQKKFKSVYEQLIVNLFFTSNWAGSKHHQLLKPHGLSQQQYNVLRILRGQYPDSASVGLITERMLDKNSNASRLLDKLLLKKYIERTISKVDRRQRDVLITQRGLELLEKIDSEFEDLEKHFTKLGVEEAKQLNDLLDKLRG